MLRLSVPSSARAAVILAAVAIAAPALVSAGCQPGSANGAQASAAATTDPVAITASPVRVSPVPVTLTLTGTLRAERQARLAAGAPGRVVKVNVDRGSVVKQGDVLAELDTSAAALSAAEAQKAAQNAKVQRESALRECDRAKVLFESGAISKSELEMRKSQCDSAELGVDAAGLRVAMGAQALRDAVVRAPFAGTIDDKSIDVGEYLMPGSPVATLVSVDRLRLDVLVPEAQLGRVSTDTSMTFRVAAFPGRDFTAKVKTIGTTVREGTRDVVVEAEIDNTDRALKPGMFASVDIVTAETPAPVVPKTAIVKRGEASHLFVVVDGRAHERVVKLGPAMGADVAVLRGVAEGDRVVAPAPDKLLNGAPVTEGR